MADALNPVVLATGLVCVVVVVLFFVAVHKRWFSRLRNGFALTLIVGMGLAGICSSAIVGTWGYKAGQRILKQQIVADLDSSGEIIEAQIQRDIAATLGQMEKLAGVMAPYVGTRSVKVLDEKLREALEFNTHLLQLRLTDAQAKVLIELSLSGKIDPRSRVASAFGLEGKSFASEPYIAPTFNKYVLNLNVPVRSGAGPVIGTMGARYDLQEALLELTRTSRFNVSGYAVVVNSDGRIIAHPNPERVNDDISGYEAVQRALRGEKGSVSAINKAGHEKLMFYRPVKSPASVNPKPLALLTEIDQSEADEPLLILRSQFALAVAVIALGCVMIALGLSSYIRKPLAGVVQMTERVEQGDLTAELAVRGQDEIARLERALNKMVTGLRERDRVKQVFGQYVATQVSEKVLQGAVNLGGESRFVTVLFSDIRNFTTMSEEMTPQQVVAFLNNYFTEMVEAVFEQGGVLDKFLGDGLMAVFGSFGDVPDHAERAVRTGLRMKALLAKINGELAMRGKPPISIGIGIHSDDVVVGNIGSNKRLQYTAVGDGVNTCSRVESLNKELGTTILITKSTYELVKDVFECRFVNEVPVKGKTKPLQVYEVLSVKAA